MMILRSWKRAEKENGKEDVEQMEGRGVVEKFVL